MSFCFTAGVVQPQPDLPTAFASASATQQASASAGEGPPQQPPDAASASDGFVAVQTPLSGRTRCTSRAALASPARRGAFRPEMTTASKLSGAGASVEISTATRGSEGGRGGAWPAVTRRATRASNGRLLGNRQRGLGGRRGGPPSAMSQAERYSFGLKERWATLRGASAILRMSPQVCL